MRTQKNNLEKTLAVFDLDGTLINSKGKLVSDVVGAFNRLGVNIGPEEIHDKNWYTLAANYNISKEAFAKSFDKRESWQESLNRGKVSMYPDAKKCLDYLKDNGAHIALLSKSNPEYTRAKVDYFGLNEYIQQIAISPVYAPSKNKEAAELVKKFPDIDKAYFIGDSEGDVTIADYVHQKFKISTGGIYVNRENSAKIQGYYNIHSLGEVPKIIKY